MNGLAMDPQVEQLLLAAEDDWATIQLAVPVRVLGFHAQQAVKTVEGAYRVTWQYVCMDARA